MTLVMACRIVTAAFSTSFLVRPDVMHTLSAGFVCQLPSLAPMLLPIRLVLRRVIRTPFASVYPRVKHRVSN